MEKYNPDIHHRRSFRLKGYDYSQAGLYFVTICCQNKECLFGEIDNGVMALNDAGRMIEKWYYELENKFPDKKCHEFIIMPNHIHLFFRLGDDDNETDHELKLKRVMNSFKRWTAMQIKPIIGLNTHFWQREWFDHWSRSHLQDQKINSYILNNPIKAGLVSEPDDWPFTWKNPRFS